MNASGHGGVVNSYTFELHGVTKDTPNPKGGEFFRDENGELTGELSDAACNVLTGAATVSRSATTAPTSTSRTSRLSTNCSLLARPGELPRRRRHHDRRRPGDAAANSTCTCASPSRGELKVARQHVLALAPPRRSDRDRAARHSSATRSSFAGIKFYADGTLGGWTAYFPDGYVGDPCRTGQLYHEPADYTELIEGARRRAADRHARAVADRHRDGHRRDRGGTGGSPRFRCTPPHRALRPARRLEQIDRMAQAGSCRSTSRSTTYNWGEGVEQAIGTPGERFNPLGEFERAGVPVTISSDAPVADPRPTRRQSRPRSRASPVAARSSALDDLAVSLDTALRGHTISAARALGSEDELGSLEAWKARRLRGARTRSLHHPGPRARCSRRGLDLGRWRARLLNPIGGAITQFAPPPRSTPPRSTPPHYPDIQRRSSHVNDRFPVPREHAPEGPQGRHGRARRHFH